MRILVSGGDGLLAHALKEAAPRRAELWLLRHGEFDLTSREQMRARLEELRPEVVINTAAYNLVDRCEMERDRSWGVNATGPEHLGELSTAASCRLVHYSTDYVFDGAKGRPYVEADTPNPLNHYAAGKLYGERAVLGAGPGHVVLRTSWLFGRHPIQQKSYVHAVLRAVREGQSLRAASDQHSVPTYALDLARWTWELVEAGAAGLFHAVNDEDVSRYEWTVAILEAAREAGLIAEMPEVEAVPTAFFNPAIRRPNYTVLSSQKLAGRLGHVLGSWREGLAKVLALEPFSR